MKLINKKNMAIEEVKEGFSWTTLFFGIFVPLIRGDFKWALIMFLLACVTFGISWLVMPFIYNGIYINELIKKGFIPYSEYERQMREETKKNEESFINTITEKNYENTTKLSTKIEREKDIILVLKNISLLYSKYPKIEEFLKKSSIEVSEANELIYQLTKTIKKESEIRDNYLNIISDVIYIIEELKITTEVFKTIQDKESFDNFIEKLKNELENISEDERKRLFSYDREGYNKKGLNKEGYDREGFNENGLDKDGYDRKGFNEKGIHKKTKSKYDEQGFDKYGVEVKKTICNTCGRRNNIEIDGEKCGQCGNKLVY